MPPHTELPQRDFLAVFGPALTERVAAAAPPLYRSPTDTPWAPLALLRRKPLGAQGLIAQAGALAIRGLRPRGTPGSTDRHAGRRRRRGLGLVAEMATGKTLLSLAMLGLADEEITRHRAPDGARPEKARFFPAVVLCPPIVVEKWAREARETLPNARPVVIRPLRTRAEVAAFRRFDPTYTGRTLSAIGCAERVVARIQAELARWRAERASALAERRTPPRKPSHLAILSTSVAKLGPAWTPVYLLRALRDTDEAGRTQLLRDPATGEPYVVPCCPRCFQPLKDEARAEHLERRQARPKREGIGPAQAGRPPYGDYGGISPAHEDDDEEAVLAVYLREAELLGETGCPRTKRTCSTCGEPLWQMVPDGTQWRASSPPLGTQSLQGRLVRPLPIPDRDHHPPSLTSTADRRYPIADYLRKRRRGLFRSVICDEAHQFKGAGTAQGFAAASLVDACNPGGTALFLTGTLFSGYASDLYPMLWRLLPELRRVFGYGDLKRWVDLYGVRQKVVKVHEARPGHREDGAVSKRREDRPLVKELPGISPLVLRHLLDSCLFLELADVAPGLPPYSEEVAVVPLGETLGPVYERFDREATAALKEMLAHEDRSGIAAWFQGLMVQPNLPWRGFTAVSSHGVVLGHAEPLPEDQIYPKERALLDLVRCERAAGRRVLVYVEHSNEYDLLPRLKALLEADDSAWREEWARGQATEGGGEQDEEDQCDASTGRAERGGSVGGASARPGEMRRGAPRPPALTVRVAILRSGTVASGEREAWLARTVEQGCDVLLCHSGLVEVGLDLLAFPTIACFEVIFSTCRARQATRRSYRPGQTQPVKVVQFVYDHAMEARGLQLIASKIKSSLMVEGKLPGEGLAAFGQSDAQGDLLLELARSVLADEEGGTRDVAGSLEATFRELAAVEEQQAGYIGDVELPEVGIQDDFEVEEDAVADLDEAEEIQVQSHRHSSDVDHDAADVSTNSGIPASQPTSQLSTVDALDPWVRWRELQRQVQPARRGARSTPQRGRASLSPPAQGGSLWAAQAPSPPVSGSTSPADASTPHGDRSAQPVQPTLWADE